MGRRGERTGWPGVAQLRGVALVRERFVDFDVERRCMARSLAEHARRRLRVCGAAFPVRLEPKTPRREMARYDFR
jgi:hypothetical protein